jgi:hypothetical protein
MDPTDCQKQLAELSYKIRSLQIRAPNQERFTEQSRLDYFEYLYEELVKQCAPNMLSKNQTLPIHPKIPQKYQ